MNKKSKSPAPKKLPRVSPVQSKSRYPWLRNYMGNNKLVIEDLINENFVNSVKNPQTLRARATLTQFKKNLNNFQKTYKNPHTYRTRYASLIKQAFKPLLLTEKGNSTTKSQRKALNASQQAEAAKIEAARNRATKILENLIKKMGKCQVKPDVTLLTRIRRVIEETNTSKVMAVCLTFLIILITLYHSFPVNSTSTCPRSDWDEQKRKWDQTIAIQKTLAKVPQVIDTSVVATLPQLQYIFHGSTVNQVVTATLALYGFMQMMMMERVTVDPKPTRTPRGVGGLQKELDQLRKNQKAWGLLRNV